MCTNCFNQLFHFFSRLKTGILSEPLAHAVASGTTLPNVNEQLSEHSFNLQDVTTTMISSSLSATPPM